MLTRLKSWFLLLIWNHVWVKHCNWCFIRSKCITTLIVRCWMSTVSFWVMCWFRYITRILFCLCGVVFKIALGSVLSGSIWVISGELIVCNSTCWVLYLLMFCLLCFFPIAKTVILQMEAIIISTKIKPIVPPTGPAMFDAKNKK